MTAIQTHPEEGQTVEVVKEEYHPQLLHKVIDRLQRVAEGGSAVEAKHLITREFPTDADEAQAFVKALIRLSMTAEGLAGHARGELVARFGTGVTL